MNGDRKAGRGPKGEGEKRSYNKVESGERVARSERPTYRKREEGGDSRPPFRGRREESGDNRNSRPPYRSDSPDRGSRPPFRREEGGDSRPPYRGRREESGDNRNSRPPYRSDSPDRGSRPPFRRDEGGDNRNSRLPYRSDSPDRGLKPAYRIQKNEGKHGDNGRTSRPSFRGGEREYSTKRPYNKQESNDRPSYRGDAAPRYGDRPERPFTEKRFPSRERDNDKSYAPTRRDDVGNDEVRSYTPRTNGGFVKAGEKPAEGDAPKSRYGQGGGYGRQVRHRDFDSKPPFERGRSSYAKRDNFERKEPRKRIIAPLAPPDDSKGVRLNKYLSNAGIAARRDADKLIEAGLVKINDVVITVLGSRVMPGDLVTYNGKGITQESKAYILLNKPKDYITTMEDEFERKTVMDLIKGVCSERVTPVGRLDRNTTGLILLTNDGDLAERLMHPRYEVKKVYIATTDKPVTGADFRQLSDGVELEDGFVKPDALEYKNPNDKQTLFVEIHSGKNHIVHRMFESLGYKLDKLDRTVYAGLTKTGLKRGECRMLSDKEVNLLRRG